MARDLSFAKRHGYPFYVICGIALPISDSRNSEINIDGLRDYWMGESADLEEIEFFSDLGRKA